VEEEVLVWGELPYNGVEEEEEEEEEEQGDAAAMDVSPSAAATPLSVISSAAKYSAVDGPTAVSSAMTTGDGAALGFRTADTGVEGGVDGGLEVSLKKTSSTWGLSQAPKKTRPDNKKTVTKHAKYSIRRLPAFISLQGNQLKKLHEAIKLRRSLV